MFCGSTPEEGAALTMAFLVREAVGSPTEILGLPAIVERPALHIADTDHQNSGFAPNRDIA